MDRHLKPKPCFIPPVGIKISQMAAKTGLNGQEYFPYQEEATNGRISTSDLKDYIQEDLIEEIGNVRDEIEQNNEEINNRIDSLDDELNAKLDQYLEEINTINDTISNTKKELEDSIDENVDTINDRIDSEVSTINSTINNVKTELQESISTTNLTLLESISSTKTELETTISSVKSDLQGLIDNVESTLSDTKSDLNETISSTKIELQESIQDTKQELENDITSTKATIDNYTVNGYYIYTNPVLTKSDIGLSNVDNVLQIPASEKAAASGVASLDANGYVPDSQLNLKTINGESIKGSGDISIDMDLYVISSYLPEDTDSIDTNKIYVVPSENHQEDNIYTEYIFVGGAWEKIGEFQPEVDLTNYVTFDDIASGSKGGIIKTGYTPSGRNYAIAVDGDGNAYVNVPWTDENTTYENATSSTAGLMSAADKSKLDGITESADAVSFTQTQTSGAEIGRITINGTTTTLYSVSSYTLPTATSSVLGGIKLGSDTEQSVAANSVSSTSGRTYAVQLNSSDQAVVNVPWTDTNTTYSEATTSTAGLMSASDKAKLDGITESADAVTVTQTQTSGTEVGRISVNGTSTTLYAPSEFDLPVATDDTLGGIKTGYTNDLNDHYFAVQIEDEKAYVRHPEGSGWEHIPEGGQSNQILMWDGDGQAAWHSSADLEIVPEQLYAYGVQFDTTVADPELTRVGNMSYHQSLPIHSQIRGCIAQGGRVQYYLDSSDFRFRATPLTQTCTISLASDGDTRVITSSYFADDRFKDAWVRINDNKFQLTNLDHDAQTAEILSSSNANYDTIEAGSHTVEFGSVRNGYDGTVRIYIPQFYIKGSTEDTTCTVYISTSQIDADYVEQPAILIDAYKATVLREVPENMGYLSTLSVNSAVSICNSETYCRGGSGSSTTYDEYLEDDPTRTWLNKGRTTLSLDNERTYARNAGAELLSYEQYKNAIYWLYVIEYANFNSQADYNANLTDSGYRQGGLGAGMTSINYAYWSIYNGNTQITPNGYLDEYGTSSAILPLRFEAFTYDYTPSTNWSSQSWTNRAITTGGYSYSIAYSDSGSTRTVTSVPYSGCYFYSRANTVGGPMSYTVAGLESGQQIRFVTSGQTTMTITYDGTFTMDWGTTYSTERQIYFDFVDTDCNITITINSTEAVNIDFAAQTITVNRWRGIDCPFGDTFLDVDGILIEAVSGGGDPVAYITTNPDNYTSSLDSLKNNYTRQLTLSSAVGYIVTQHLGTDADIMPSVASGGSSSTYMCDYFWLQYMSATVRLRIGGGAAYGSNAGLGALACYYSVSNADSIAGFRTVNTFES